MERSENPGLLFEESRKWADCDVDEDDVLWSRSTQALGSSTGTQEAQEEIQDHVATHFFKHRRFLAETNVVF